MKRHRKGHKNKHIKLKDEEKKNTKIEVDVENNTQLIELQTEVDRKKLGVTAVRLPVVIAETTVDINLKNTVNFTKDVINIIDIRRKAIIKRCKLIPQINRFFLDGVVIKSIEYSEETRHRGCELNGRAKNLTIKLPFRCAESIEYINAPVTYEFSYKNNEIIRMSENEKSFIDKQQEADEIYCELVSAEFKELNVKDKIRLIDEAKKISTFKQIKQSMSMDITIRLLQKQTIIIKNG
ncbi:DUF7852 domain-containing protein [Clostridium guangxiense]|uniref:DUF7852 domain-containing protein n=1 Tax=Clostridium guangxiense TaxID=1662055 RepID=UPI001E541A4B|nr:hypothetical protein [Clostridium guangxiense]MCD2348001.1 hypothetical protein [Clostridium guangxiense]